MLERESLAPTAFGNLVAIPHPNKAVTDDTFVCAAVLHKPIMWGEHRVQFIFMMSLQKGSMPQLQRFSGIISKMLFSKTYVHDMIHHPSFETLQRILNEIENSSE